MDVIDKKPGQSGLFYTAVCMLCFCFNSVCWWTIIHWSTINYSAFSVNILDESNDWRERSQLPKSCFLMHKCQACRSSQLHRTWSGYKLANQMVSSAVETIFLTFSNTIYIVSTRMASEFWMKGQSQSSRKDCCGSDTVSQCQWYFDQSMLTICVWPPVNSNYMLT